MCYYLLEVGSLPYIRHREYRVVRRLTRTKSGFHPAVHFLCIADCDSFISSIFAADLYSRGAEFAGTARYDASEIFAFFFACTVCMYGVRSTVEDSQDFRSIDMINIKGRR